LGSNRTISAVLALSGIAGAPWKTAEADQRQIPLPIGAANQLLLRAIKALAGQNNA